MIRKKTDTDGAEDTSTFFLGFTKEVGPGTLEVGYGSTDMDPFATGIPVLTTTETVYLYEASYGWSINDATTATVGGFIQERTTANGDDLTGIAFTTSFAF